MNRLTNFLIAILFIGLFFSCNSHSNDPLTSNESTGKVQLKLDKSAAPDEVIIVRVTLSRTGYQSLTANMNIKTSSSAEVLFKDLPVGTWHLLIEAFDAYNVVQYKGETDVTVIANTTVNASLVLTRVTSYGVGNIFISVTWDAYTYQSTWTDYNSNPILTAINNSTLYGPYFGRVLYDEGKFKMWFGSSYGSDRYEIGYAESYDGFKWQVINNGVIKPGYFGSWDSYGVHPGAVIKEDGIFKMYYTGQSRENDPADRRIGLATSTDGVNWNKAPVDIVNRINIFGLTTDIVKVNGVYYLYYGNPSVIGGATSTDGVNWQKTTKNVISASESWEGNQIWSCSVIYENGKFKMLYNTSNYKHFGYAESADGINFTKRSTPVFSYDNTYNRWPEGIRYPFFRKVGQTYFIYYSTVSSGYNCRMGVATTSTLF